MIATTSKLTYDETIRKILSLSLPPAAKVVLVYLFDKQGENSDSWPAITTICRDCALSRDAVWKSIGRLDKKNLLKVEREPNPAAGRTNRYSVNLTSLENRPVRKTDRYEKQTPTIPENRTQPLRKTDSNDSYNGSINDSLHAYGEFVRLKDSEFWKLVSDLGLEKTQEMVEALNDYIGSKGKKYKSHYHTIRAWVRKDEKDGRSRQYGHSRKAKPADSKPAAAAGFKYETVDI